MAAKPPPSGRRTPDASRGSLPQILFWAGMALAPVAVLVLLFGQSNGALRVAVVLAVITIVLLAFSMAIRPSVDMVRVDIEHRVLDEMERIRLRAQGETHAVARHTQKALTDQLHQLNETIADLRAQVDEVQAFGYFEPGPPAIGPGPMGSPPPPGVRRTETVHVTRRTTYDDTGTVYGSRSAGYGAGHEGRPPAVDGEWYDDRPNDDLPWTVRAEQRALPPADDRYDERGRYDDRYDDRDRGYDRGRYDDRYADRDRGYERDRGRYEDRGNDDRYDDRDRGYERDRRGYDDRGRDRYDDRGYDDRDRYDDRRVPRQRSPEW